MVTVGTAGLEIFIEGHHVDTQHPENGRTTAELNKYEGREVLIKKKMEEKRLKMGIESDWDLSNHASLYKMAIKRNWKFISQYTETTPNSLFAHVSATFETLLHVLASTKEPEAVSLLKKLMRLVKDPKSLEQTEMSGMTTLHYAAVYGNAEAARILLSKNRNLLNIKDDHGLAPLYYAAKSGQAETVYVLLKSAGRTSVEGLIDIGVVDQLITNNLFGIALDLLKNYSQRPLDDETLLLFFNKLATKAVAFQSGRQLGFWQRLFHGLVNKCAPVEGKDFSPRIYEMGDVENLFEGSEKAENHAESKFPLNIFESFGVMLWKVHVLIWEVIKRLVPVVQQIVKEKLKYNQAYLLLKHLCEEFERSNHSHEDAITILKEPLHKAASMGIHEIVNEVLETYPKSIIFFDEEDRNVVQLAVLHKREKVFIDIIERSSQIDISLLEDKFGNNLLHYAGKLTPSTRIPAATLQTALQMQREMQWFKVLEGLVHPSLLEAQNNDKKTPWEVFTEEHRELMKKGEEWMKSTATSCTVVATLIATVVFAAAFTVPGGIDGNKGTPIFLGHSSLLTFMVADALAFVCSCSSILKFLGVITARYSAIDFMKSLPIKLMLGLIGLNFSMICMITTFGAALHILVFRRLEWVDIPFSLIAGLPVIVLLLLQYPLPVIMFFSTYYSKICRLKRS